MWAQIVLLQRDYALYIYLYYTDLYQMNILVLRTKPAESFADLIYNYDLTTSSQNQTFWVWASDQVSNLINKNCRSSVFKR